MPSKALAKRGSKRVSIFVSHKVESHRLAAARIKAILESRAERLDLHICEDILAGDRWPDWIENNLAHSQILLVLLPHVGADETWIVEEIKKFEAACPGGRRIILKSPTAEIPDCIRDLQIIDASKEHLLEHFLVPLYRRSTFTPDLEPLNPRVSNVDLGRDAQEIEDALLGIVDSRPKVYGESLIVKAVELDPRSGLGLDSAVVWAPNGCSQMLNWDRKEFYWKELRERAAEDKGKGTFWVTEMEQVMLDVARQNTPTVMTSTFRGRGRAVGQIFKPQLNKVDFVATTPVRYHFAFYEVLVPELVRGPEQIGEVFNLLHIATRARWEVFNPFLVKLFRFEDTPPSRQNPSSEAQHELISTVKASLRIIELEAERHQMLHEGVVNSFNVQDHQLVAQLLKDRSSIRAAIQSAADRDDFEQLMTELTRGLELNCAVMDLLVSRFLQLVKEDSARVREMLQRACPAGLESNRALKAGN